MNIPNALSLFRIALAPLFVGLYIRGQRELALLLLVLSAASDVADGYIARHFNMESRLGRILDPIGDKLFEAAMMLCAASRVRAVWLLLGLHLTREGLLAVLGLAVLRRCGIVLHARWYGKLCTCAIYAVMLAIIALPALPHVWARLGIAICAVLMVLCMVLYALDFLRLLKGRKEA